jgi:hypothetical protein
MVMPFGVKNGPPTFQRAISRAFKKTHKLVYEDTYKCLHGQ